MEHQASTVDVPDMPSKEGIELTEQEREIIMFAFLRGRGAKGVTAEELTDLWNECLKMKIEGLILKWILEGKIDLDWDGTEISMRLSTDQENG
jgi:hypothetical protein